MTPLPPSITDFLSRYRDAFCRLDGVDVAALCDSPLTIISTEGTSVYADASAARANMVALCDVYRQSGFIETTYEVIAHVSQSPDFHWVDVEWCIHRAADAPRPTERFRTSYQLGKRAGDWRVCSITAYAEQRFWADK